MVEPYFNAFLIVGLIKHKYKQVFRANSTSLLDIWSVSIQVLDSGDKNDEKDMVLNFKNMTVHEQREESEKA